MSALNIDAQTVHGATFGEVQATSGQTIRDLLQMTEEELQHYGGNPPPSLYAQVTDRDGNVYEGTLLLVEKKIGEA